MVDNIENQEKKVGKSASHRSAKDLHELVDGLAKTMEERYQKNCLHYRLIKNVKDLIDTS